MEIDRKAIFDNNKIYVVKDSMLIEKTVNIHKIKNATVLFSGINEGEKVVSEVFLGATEGMKVVPLK
jgi:hypothetical protein